MALVLLNEFQKLLMEVLDAAFGETNVLVGLKDILEQLEVALDFLLIAVREFLDRDPANQFLNVAVGQVRALDARGGSGRGHQNGPFEPTQDLRA